MSKRAAPLRTDPDIYEREVYVDGVKIDLPVMLADKHNGVVIVITPDEHAQISVNRLAMVGLNAVAFRYDPFEMNRAVILGKVTHSKT